MSDDCDKASEIEEQDRQDALQAIRAQLSASAGPAALVCDECDELIAEARRQAMPGCRLCIYCQEALERDQRTWVRLQGGRT